MSTEETIISDVWACSKSCASPADKVSPVITADGKQSLEVLSTLFLELATN